MKDKLLELKDGEKYYVVEELNYQNHKYVFAINSNLVSQDEVSYVVMEIKLIDEKLVVDEIEETKAIEVVNEFRKKFQESVD